MARTPSAPVTYTQAEIDAIGAKSALSLTAADRAKLAKWQKDQSNVVNQPIEDALAAVQNTAIMNRLTVRDFILAEAALADARAALSAEVESQGLYKTLKASSVPGKGRQSDVTVLAIPVRRTSFADAMGILEQVLEDASNPGHVLPALVGRQLSISVFESCIAAQTPASTIQLLVHAGVLAPVKTEGAERSSGKYVVTGTMVTRAEMEKLVERQVKEEATAPASESAEGAESAPAAEPTKGKRGGRRAAK